MFADDPARRDDPSWLHRGQRPRDRYAARHDPDSTPGRVFRRVTKLLSVRRATPEFAGEALLPFHVDAPAVVGYQRIGLGDDEGDARVLVLLNVGDDAAVVDARTLSGFAASADDLVSGVEVNLADGVVLAPLAFTWLRVRAAE